jgi:hypothetical protein
MSNKCVKIQYDDINMKSIEKKFEINQKSKSGYSDYTNEPTLEFVNNNIWDSDEMDNTAFFEQKIDYYIKRNVKTSNDNFCKVSYLKYYKIFNFFIKLCFYI